jgi:hypothetical protein
MLQLKWLWHSIMGYGWMQAGVGKQLLRATPPAVM